MIIIEPIYTYTLIHLKLTLVKKKSGELVLISKARLIEKLANEVEPTMFYYIPHHKTLRLLHKYSPCRLTHR